jgi:cyclic beta-1,2-glucan synthetase
MNDTVPILDPQQNIEGDVLERIYNATRESRSWDVVLRPKGPGVFPARVRAARLSLERLERRLARRPRAEGGSAVQESSIERALHELELNPRLLRSAVMAVSDRPKIMAQLPRVTLEGRATEPRIAAAAASYLRAVNGEFSADTFRSFMKACQAFEPFTVNELWNFAAFLRFVLLESILEDGHALLRSESPVSVSMLSVRLKSLRAITNADLVFLIEPLILFDATLNQDPAGTYARMDFESRELYRKRIAYVACYSDCAEGQVAQAALDLARMAGAAPSSDPRIQLCRAHVGYYLIGKGFPQLAERVGFHAPVSYRARRFVQAHGEHPGKLIRPRWDAIQAAVFGRSSQHPGEASRIEGRPSGADLCGSLRAVPADPGPGP